MHGSSSGSRGTEGNLGESEGLTGILLVLTSFTLFFMSWFEKFIKRKLRVKGTEGSLCLKSVVTHIGVSGPFSGGAAQMGLQYTGLRSNEQREGISILAVYSPETKILLIY